MSDKTLQDTASDPERRVDVSVEDAARALVAFMCCRAGEEFVDRNLLRPFGYTLEPGPVVRSNHNLADGLEQIELQLDDLRDRWRSGSVTFEEMLRTLERLSSYSRRLRENNPAEGS